jgi:anhydro-N-acetylmuramic acid kinase
VVHIAGKIADTFEYATGKVLVTGGGAWNDFLLDKIRERTTTKIVVPNKDLVNFKEALIFAFLGLLRWRGEANCLKSVTGASRDVSGGCIYLP